MTGSWWNMEDAENLREGGETTMFEKYLRGYFTTTLPALHPTCQAYLRPVQISALLIPQSIGFGGSYFYQAKVR